MSKQYKNGTCSCWKQVDDQIPEGESLDVGFNLSGHEFLKIATHRADKKRKSNIYASYCPFCGKKLVKPKEEVS